MSGKPYPLRGTDGPAAGRLLLIDGLAGSPSIWSSFADLAAPEYEIWHMDVPWGSPGVRDWGLDHDLVRWLSPALESGTGSGPFDVAVAHSFGANLLLELLCRDQLAAPPSKVVLVSPFYRPSADSFDWATMSYFLNEWHLLLEEGVRVRASGRMSARSLRDTSVKLRDLLGPYAWIRFFDTYLRTPELRVDRLTSRFLVVGGDSDPASADTDSQHLADRLPDSRLVILPGCRHFAMVEYGIEFAKLVSEFLAPVSLPTAPPTRQEQTDHEHDPALTSGQHDRRGGAPPV